MGVGGGTGLRLPLLFHWKFSKDGFIIKMIKTIDSFRKNNFGNFKFRRSVSETYKHNEINEIL